MAELENQKILRIADKTKPDDTIPEFITEDVVEVRRARMVYYKWISRLMALLATISLVYSISATLVLLNLVPKIIYDAQIFVQFSDSGSYVKRELIEPTMESREKIMVNLIKQYVELRNTYIHDPDEMNKRWLWGGLVSYLSTYEVYQDFAKVYPRVKDDLDRKNASRSVEILSVKRTGGEKSRVWEVEFKTYDFSYEKNETYRPRRRLGPIIEERFWTVNIECRAISTRRTAYRRLLNPLGFVVVRYFQSEIEG